MKALFLWLLVALSLSLFVVGERAAACPSCMPLPMTLAEELEVSRAVVVAAPMGGKPGNRYRVLKTLKGNVKPDRILLALPSSGSATVLLCTSGEVGSPFWSGRPYPINPAEIKFAEAVLQLPVRKSPSSVERRLAFFVGHLAPTRNLRSDSAYAEFALASYAEMERFSKIVGAKKLRLWLEGKVNPEYVPLFLMMLAQSGGPTDIAWLEPRLMKAAQREPGQADQALLFCYLRLKGPAGLEVVQQRFLQGSRYQKSNALVPLRLMVDLKGPIPQSEILPIFRAQLQDPEMAGQVLQDLAVWGDWSCLPQVVPLLKLPQQHRFTTIMAVRYLVSCPLPLARQEVQRLSQSPEWSGGLPPPFRLP